MAPAQSAITMLPSPTLSQPELPVMKYLRSFFAATTLSACTAGVFAADYTDGDRHKNDFNWMQFNLMYALEELPRPKKRRLRA